MFVGKKKSLTMVDKQKSLDSDLCKYVSFYNVCYLDNITHISTHKTFAKSLSYLSLNFVKD